MADPIAQEIIEVLRARLRCITRVRKFWTDAGKRVIHGRLRIDNSLGLHIALFAGASKEKEDAGRNRVEVQLFVEIAACVPIDVDDDDQGRDVELVKGDIQKAVETGQRNLGGIGRDITPVGGGRLAPIPKSTNEYVSLTYVVSYHRVYGAPDQRV